MFNPLAEPMLPTPYRVLKVVRETGDTFTLTLAPAGGEEGFSFAPGQFNMLYVFGVGEAPISISGDPDRTETLVHTVRAVGAVSRGICGLKKGETLGVRGPFGVPWPVAKAPGWDVLVIAGGLGLAPLRPAVYYLLARRPEYGNLELIYGARTPEDLVFRRELERWRGRFDFRVHVTVDAARNDWRGNVGVVPNLLARARFDPDQTMALICGPGVMMRFTVQELLNRGLKMENIYVSLERNMKCGLGLCGHCQLGPFFVCKDGPVFPYDRVRDWFLTREV
ncbi:MAG: FAD/NAD(P)-binding protein [Deltaproteobacteria bacterium]|nr:FAD/NAD(P)-binding protein [Deltaproteobacteria bacterium]